MDYNTVLGTKRINGTEYPITTGFLVMLFVKNLSDILAVHTFFTANTTSGWVVPAIAAIFLNILTVIEFKRDFDDFHGNADYNRVSQPLE